MASRAGIFRKDYFVILASTQTRLSGSVSVLSNFEVMEAGFNAKLLSLPAKDLLNKLKYESCKV